jgi:hypothetical protein
MLTTIGFDDELSFTANKIGHVARDLLLPNKLESLQATVA